MELRGHLVCEATRRGLNDSGSHGSFDPFDLNMSDEQSRELVEACATRMTVDERTRNDLIRFFCEQVLTSVDNSHLGAAHARAS